MGRPGAAVSETSFRYRAASMDGRLHRGRLSASTRDDALRTLSDRGLHPISITGDSVGGTHRARLPVGDLALSLRLLADLLDAGLPLARALQLLETMAAPSVATLLPAVIADIKEGLGLATALTNANARVPNDILGVIRAGERGSGLPAAIRQAATLCETAAETRAAVLNALAYPVVLGFAGALSLGLLVGVVLPRFASILGDLGQSLPPTTRLVLQAGSIARVAAAPVVVAIVLVLVLWRAWTATESGRRRWHAALLRVPMIGAMRLCAGTALLCDALAALLASGVSIVPALVSASAAVNDAELVSRLAGARGAVEHGSRLSDALLHSGAVTASAYRLVRAGEESGRLPSMLAHAGGLHRAEVVRRIKGAV
ncbi:MAG: type secretion system protein, partial [Gemmatimonadetes bacterium]|nr:type secretion system protein [Gemmatimonadota bacterium]